MDTFRVEKTIPKSKTLTIKLPFRAGQKVEVVVKSQKRTRTRARNTKYPLRGKLVRYVDPFKPVAQDDWEANR